MRQVLQHLGSGKLEVLDLPAPAARAGSVLIRTKATLISAGTERMLLEFGRANLLQKARQQPERVRQVLEKVRTDGLAPTLAAVASRLDEPLALGYCNAGEVLAVGAGVEDLRVGDRVASNGPHAEVVCVPRHLCARIPDEVDDEAAAFTVLGSIALQGLRLAAPTLGERFVVFGAGLLGLVTIQLLRANGCEVLAVDLNPGRLELAARLGARTVDAGAGGDPVAVARAWSGGHGVDGVLITASAKGDEIVHQAAQSARRNGRIVLVGVVGLNLRRSDFFEKELSFRVSCSYGPGRYDQSYEEGGRDYPYGFVRWTEQRNFEAVLATMRSKALDVAPLITDRFDIADAAAAYDKIQHDGGALGVILRYPGEPDLRPAVQLRRPAAAVGERPVVGVIGAGVFAKGVLLPALARTPACLRYVASRTAATARHAAQKFGAEQALTDYRALLADAAVDAVFVLVGHEHHARMVCEALAAGKHVFVEKPLALDAAELEQVTAAASAASERRLLVGFNRRFSPHVVRIAELLRGRAEPLCMAMTVNAGALPADHWMQDPARGGGRIIGEACHFIDLLACLAGAPVTSVSALAIGAGPAVRHDKVTIQLGFGDGSIGSVNYFSNGPRSYPKETLEVFSDGRVLRLDNFRVTRGYGFRGFTRFKTRSQDKGHEAEVAAFIARLGAGGEPLIPFEQLHNVTLASFAAVDSAKEGRTIRL